MNTSAFEIAFRVFSTQSFSGAATICEKPVISNGESGFLAAVGDVQTMTERAIAVLRDPERLEEMRRRAVARAADFSADRIVPQYERLYEDVLRD